MLQSQLTSGCKADVRSKRPKEFDSLKMDQLRRNRVKIHHPHERNKHGPATDKCNGLTIHAFVCISHLLCHYF